MSRISSFIIMLCCSGTMGILIGILGVIFSISMWLTVPFSFIIGVVIAISFNYFKIYDKLKKINFS